MRKPQSDPEVSLTLETRGCSLLVSDVVGYLSGLAKLHEEEKTGNPELSKGLRHLIRALRRYADCPLPELSDVLRGKSSRSNWSKRIPIKAKLTLPPHLEDVQIIDVERILKNDGYTKQQVAELGCRRFGLSQSMLTRLSKEEAVASVRVALEHEKTLDVIAREARKSGSVRVS